MDLIGKQISKNYIITDFLDEGGMSWVYKGVSIVGEKPVAIKVLREGVSSRRAEDIIRFRREATTVSKLDHPNLVKVYEICEYEGLNCIVMELVEGEKLDQYLPKTKELEIGQAVKIVMQIGRALEYVHGIGVIHRDLKPANIMVTRDEEGEICVKILDFGLAKVMELTKIKEIGEIVGTFSYMSPEQSGIIKKPVDERSDLYSLGIMFYQLLTDELPFKGEDIGTILHQQIAREALPPRYLNVEIPEILERIVMKLLKKDPEERYQTAQGLMSDLELYKQGEKDFILGKEDRLTKLTYRTRLIGREDELGKLKWMYDEAKAGRGRVCFLRGEAGRGKSRLVDELRGYVYEEGGEFISGKSFAQENKIPYQSFTESLNEHISRINKLEHEDRQERINKMRASVGALGEIVCRLNPVMREVLGEVPQLVELDPERENQRFLMVCSNFFLNLGQKGEPIVMVLNDLQWADGGTIKLLGEIVEGIRGHSVSVLVIGTYRDDEVKEGDILDRLIKRSRERRLGIEYIDLKNFDLARLNHFVSELLMEEESRMYDLSRYIYSKSKGNPFFTLEIIRQLVEEKALTNKDGHWQVNLKKLSAVTISETIVEILLKRIKLLSADQMEVLSTAAVIGRKFRLELLYALMDKTIEELIILVDEAIEMQLLERSTWRGEILFVHDRIKDAFYREIGEERKKELHLKVAKVLERLHKKDKEEVLFDLAHHYVEGGEKEKMLEYGLPAAEKAKEDYANAEAIKYYEIALDISEEKGLKANRDWIRAKEGLTEVYLTIGKSKEAIQICEELLPFKKLPFEKAKLYKQINSACFRTGDFREGENALAKGLSFLGEKYPRTRVQTAIFILRELLIRILHCIFPALFLHKKGKPVRKEDVEIASSYIVAEWMIIIFNIEKFVGIAFRLINLVRRRIGKSKELGMALGILGIFYASLSFFKKAKRLFNESLDIVKDERYEWGIGRVKGWMAYPYCWNGEHQRSIEIVQQSIDQYAKIGDIWEFAIMTQLKGLGYFYQGNYAAASEFFSQYFELSKKIKDNHGICCGYNLLSRVYIEKGEVDKADEYAKQSAALSEKDKIWFVACRANANLGYVKIEQGKYDESIKYLANAVKIDKEEGATFAKDYIVYYHIYLAKAYLERFKNRHVEKKRKELKKIKKRCRKAITRSRFWPNHYGGALRVAGEYYALTGKKRKAEKYFLKSIAHTERIGRRYEEAHSRYEYGKFLKDTEREEDAIESLKKACDIFNEIGAKLYIKKTRELLGIKEEKEEMAAKKEATPQERLEAERRMVAVLDTSRYISSVLEMDDLLEKIMDKTIELVGAERGILLMYPEEKAGKGELEIKVVKNIEKEGIGAEEFEVSRSIIEKVEREQEAVIIEDASTDEELKDKLSVVRSALRSVLCVPIKARGKMLGVIYLDNHLVRGLFTQEDLWVLHLISNQAGVSIENARLYKRAVTDGLTGLYNHVFFENYLIKSVELAERYGKKLSIMIIDIDNFKEFNDRYGHQAGDLVIRSVSDLIMNNMRKSDLAARYGGDEFVMVLWETGKEGSRKVAERIRRAVEGYKIKYGRGKEEKELNVTVSIGISELGEGYNRIKLIEEADKALYKVKDKGRNAVVVSE